MYKAPIVLHRKGKPSWSFEWNITFGAYIHKTYANEYRLFLDDDPQGKPFWIGRLHGDCWYSVEGQIGADYIDFCNSRLVFNPKVKELNDYH